MENEVEVDLAQLIHRGGVFKNVEGNTPQEIYAKVSKMFNQYEEGEEVQYEEIEGEEGEEQPYEEIEGEVVGDGEEQNYDEEGLNEAC